MIELDTADHRRSPATNLGVTSIYLEGIDSAEIIDTVHACHAPMITAGGRPAAGAGRRGSLRVAGPEFCSVSDANAAPPTPPR
jgi:hypothetical protein